MQLNKSTLKQVDLLGQGGALASPLCERVKVNVIDALMGQGKTSWAIQMINEQPEQKFIYVTPYLAEVARIKAACPLAKFYEPQQEGRGKLDSFHALLAEGESIVTTHALFSSVTEETRQLLEANGYILVLDEVMDVLQDEPLKKDDLRTILSNGFAHVEDDGCLVWDDSLYDGRFNDIKTKAANRSLYLVNGCLLMWTFPVSIFHCFKEIFILTYMFHAQIQSYYFKMNDVQFDMLRVYQDGERYEVKEHDGTLDDVSHLQIDIYDGKLNDIGKAKTALSKTWYLRASKEKLVELKTIPIISSATCVKALEP
ncbi:MAG: hypothetical protein E6713_10380 [Sporomusaceae bacterium]|nr:hypothetical protein [Sporomusaceae bacterium]